MAGRLVAPEDLRLAASAGAAALAATALGALACALLPISQRPSYAAVLPGAAALGALGLALLIGSRRAPPPFVLALADLAAVGLVAWLVARTDGSDSVLAALYLFALLHAAAFQASPSFTLVAVATIGAFLSPLVYDHGGSALTAVAVLVMPPVLLGAVGVHAATRSLRSLRERLIEHDGALEPSGQVHEVDLASRLGSYRAFWNGLEAEVARAHRHGESFTLVLVDLGPCAGGNGAAARAPTDALLRSVRDCDLCCRLAGDEFAILAVRTDAARAAELAGRLAASVAAVSASSPRRRPPVGWATFGEPAASGDELLTRASAALRAARRREARRPGARGVVAG